MGSTALEDAAFAVPDSLKWVQLYILRSREVTRDIVERAEKAGYKAIVVKIGKRLTDFQTHSLNTPAKH